MAQQDEVTRTQATQPATHGPSHRMTKPMAAWLLCASLCLFSAKFVDATTFRALTAVGWAIVVVALPLEHRRRKAHEAAMAAAGTPVAPQAAWDGPRMRPGFKKAVGLFLALVALMVVVDIVGG